MTKKYNLILAKYGQYLLGYVNDGGGHSHLNDTLYDKKLNEPYAQFTQDDINKLKATLPTKGMRAVVDASKVEVKVPLYYMQTKHRDDDGLRGFYYLRTDNIILEKTECYKSQSIREFLVDKRNGFREHVLLPEEDWEPYLTPDRELVKYEPKEDE